MSKISAWIAVISAWITAIIGYVLSALLAREAIAEGATTAGVLCAFISVYVFGMATWWVLQARRLL